MSALHIRALRRQECEAFMEFSDIKEGMTVRAKTFEQLKEYYHDSPYVMERLKAKRMWCDGDLNFIGEMYAYCGCKMTVESIDESDDSFYAMVTNNSSNIQKAFWYKPQWVAPIDNATNIDIKQVNELI